MKAAKKIHPIAHFTNSKVEAYKKANASMQAFKKSLTKKDNGGPFDGILPTPSIGEPSSERPAKPLDASFRVGSFSGGMKTNLNADKPLDTATYKLGYAGKKGFGVNVGYDTKEKKANAGVSYEGTLGKNKKVPIKVDVSYNKQSKLGGAIKKGKSKKK
jgi:hypothetical protein